MAPSRAAPSWIGRASAFERTSQSASNAGALPAAPAGASTTIGVALDTTKAPSCRATDAGAGMTATGSPAAQAAAAASDAAAKVAILLITKRGRNLAAFRPQEGPPPLGAYPVITMPPRATAGS